MRGEPRLRLVTPAAQHSIMLTLRRGATSRHPTFNTNTLYGRLMYIFFEAVTLKSRWMQSGEEE
jgi:hypothetical protein